MVLGWVIPHAMVKGATFRIHCTGHLGGVERVLTSFPKEELSRKQEKIKPISQAKLQLVEGDTYLILLLGSSLEFHPTVPRQR